MTSLSKHAMQPNSVRLCQGCELPVDIVDLPNGKMHIAHAVARNYIAEAALAFLVI